MTLLIRSNACKKSCAEFLNMLRIRKIDENILFNETNFTPI